MPFEKSGLWRASIPPGMSSEEGDHIQCRVVNLEVCGKSLAITIHLPRGHILVARAHRWASPIPTALDLCRQTTAPIILSFSTFS